MMCIVFIFNVIIVIIPIRKCGRYIKADKYWIIFVEELWSGEQTLQFNAKMLKLMRNGTADTLINHISIIYLLIMCLHK